MSLSGILPFLSSTETLISIALILILIDIFFLSDIPTMVAYGVLAYAFGRELPFDILYQIVGGLLIFFLLIACHYLFFKNLLQNIANKYIAPDKYKQHTEAIIGKEGTIEIIEGTPAVRVEGNLWDFVSINHNSVSETQKVKILDFKDGKLIIE